MRVFTLILVASALFVFVSCKSKDEFTKQFEKMEKSSFGRSLLQTIYLQVQTSDPLSNLIGMLEDLDASIDESQQKNDVTHERIQSSCSNDLAELTDVIGSTIITQLSLKSELDQLNPQKNVAVSSLQRKIGELNDLENDLAQQTDRRENEHDTYLDVLERYEETLYSINQIKNYFNEYLDVLVKNRRQFDREQPSSGSEGFLSSSSSDSGSDDDSSDDSYNNNRGSNRKSDSDSDDDNNSNNGSDSDDDNSGSDDGSDDSDDFEDNQSFAQIAPKINKLQHQIKQEGYKALISLLVKMVSIKQSESSETEILTRKIISIVKQIEQFVQDQRNKEDLAENGRELLFEELTETYTNQIIDSTASKGEMEGIIESLSNQLSSLQNEKFEIDVKLTTKQAESEDRGTECDAEQQEYDNNTDKRTDQRLDLSIALKLISEKLGLLKKAILEKGEY